MYMVSVPFFVPNLNVEAKIEVRGTTEVRGSETRKGGVNFQFPIFNLQFSMLFRWEGRGTANCLLPPRRGGGEGLIFNVFPTDFWVDARS